MVFKVIEIVRAFVMRFLQAFSFAILEYDTKLQVNKTPKERFLIWTKIVISAIVIASLLILSLKLVLGF